jgi:hypothetical protein
MKSLSAVTGLPFDTAMVFPHGIGATDVLAYMKRLNFAATFNSANVPIDDAANVPLPPSLRSATMDFGGIASVKRYPAVQSPTINDSARIAIDLFLGNPVVRYTHHDFFATGSDAFDSMARIINGMNDHVLWGSLGEVASYLYLERAERRGHHRVLAFSPRIVVANDHPRYVAYTVLFPHANGLPIEAVDVDGAQVDHEYSADSLVVRTSLPPGAEARISVVFRSGVDTDTVPVARTGIRRRLLRALSELRDVHVSRMPGGLALVRAYYDDPRAFFTKAGVGACGIGGLIVWLAIATAGFRGAARARRAEGHGRGADK